VFNVGGPEILVILVVALLILGPDQLPKAMRAFGNAQAQIKKVSGGFRDEIQNAVKSLETEPEPTRARSARPEEVPSEPIRQAEATSPGHPAAAAGSPAPEQLEAPTARARSCGEGPGAGRPCGSSGRLIPLGCRTRRSEMADQHNLVASLGIGAVG